MKTKKLISIVLFVFSCAYAQGQTDTLSNSGDPTDPNCPCYNVQLKAEKEYQEMITQQRKVREDSLLALHKKSKDQTKKRMRQNAKRKKKKDCPQAMLNPSLKAGLGHVNDLLTNLNGGFSPMSKVCVNG